LRRTLGREIWIWGITHKLEVDDLAQRTYQWACDACLDSGRATEGDPQKQLYCDFDPWLAYFDSEKTCENCGSDYIFTRQEQLLWYEKFRFWVQSKPKYCAACRKIKRQKKRMNKELSEVLAKKENLRTEDMERLSVIYAQINRPDRSQYYLNLIRKRNAAMAAGTKQAGTETPTGKDEG
jgi:hypothetical protein